MADLIAFIYSLGFEDEERDRARGTEVLAEKGCITGHKEDGSDILP